MNEEQIIAKLKELGWCYQPEGNPFTDDTRVMVGPRLNSESYGPFPNGFVTQVMGKGDSLQEALERGLRRYEQMEAVKVARGLP